MRTASSSVFHPRQVAAVSQGSYYLPGSYTGLGTAGFQWTDQRSAQHFTQATTSKQPTPGVGPSGQPIWTLDGGDTIVVATGGSSSWNWNRGIYAYWLKLAVDDTNFQCVLSIDNGSNARRFSAWKYNAVGQFQAFPGDGTTVTAHVADGIDADAWNYYEWVWDQAAAAADRLRLFVNRVEVPMAADGPAALGVSLSQPVYLWSNNDTGLNVTGEFGPLYVARAQGPALPTDFERDQLYRYLAPIVIP